MDHGHGCLWVCQPGVFMILQGTMNMHRHNRIHDDYIVAFAAACLTV